MIYYSHINEDNSAEREVLNAGSFQDLFCVAGSGERLIALLDHPTLETVHVIDTNLEALYLAELKLAALKKCSVTTYLEFIGARTTDLDREEIFQQVKSDLSAACANYWDGNLPGIEKGILHIGHFENFLANFRPLLKLYLGSGFYQCFQRPFDECRSFPHKRWKLIRWLYSQRWVYLLAGNKDIAFTAKDGEQELIPEALQQTLQEGTVSQNCLFHLIFNGHLNLMPKQYAPPSLQPLVLARIQEILRHESITISYYHQDVLAFAKAFDFKPFRKRFFSLSDILSFDKLEYIRAIHKTIRVRASKSATLILRTFIRNRISTTEAEALAKELGPIKDLSHLDKTKFYQVYEISQES